jgi:hypothetical protein
MQLQQWRAQMDIDSCARDARMKHSMKHCKPMNCASLLRSLLVGLTLIAFSAAAEAPADVRIALVIGNAAYVSVPALANSANDAKAMGDTLRGLGFKVIEVRDGNKARMNEAVQQVRDLLKGKQGVGMLYYAGHGLQMDARNFMVPVDAKLKSAADVTNQSVDVGSVIQAFKAAGNRMNILVLDACRDNPFGGITSGRGLAPLDAPSGTFLAYATAPGNVAEDGDVKTGNGLYTQYLLQELKKPQARIEDVFKRVRFSVRKASSGRQIPWESTSLEDDFTFNDGRVVAAAPPTEQQLQAAFSQEKPDWDRIKRSNNPDDFYAFLQKYPSGTISEAAHARLNELTKPALRVQDADGSEQAYALTKFRVGDVYEQRSSTVHTRSGAAPISGTGTTRFTVQSVQADRIEVMVQYPGTKSPDMLQVYDGNGGLRQMGDVFSYDPPQSRVPGGLLQVGRTWSSAYQVTFGAKIRQPSRTQASTTRIVAREQVATPAGRFNAYRLENINRDADSGTTASRNIVWMTPELPLPVRIDTTVNVPGGFTTHTVTEMTKVVRGG